MRYSWYDVAGWQWVFLIEGAPAVLFGALVPFLMTDRPSQATWLSQADREWLEQTLQRERAEAAAAGNVTLVQALRQPSVWVLSLGILATNTGGYAMGFWMPTFIDNILKAPLEPLLAASTAGLIASCGGDGPLVAASALASNASPPTGALSYLGLVYLCGLAGVLISGQSSDRAGERKWHCIAGQIGTGVFLAISSLIPGQPFGLVMVWLCLMGFCAYFWPSPFWVLPTMSMSASAAAVSIGVINICANVAGHIGSTTVGHMKASGWSDAMCMLFGSSCYVAGGVIIAMLRVRPKPASSER
jgi:ACS family tartrate transporter-like MFS transporter